MSRKGNCWDNAIVEGLFSTLAIRLRRLHATLSFALRWPSIDETGGEARSDVDENAWFDQRSQQRSWS